MILFWLHVLNVDNFRKFIVIEFIKYSRAQCLETHLKVYYIKMIKVIYDEKLLIYYFQESLFGSTLS